MIDFVPSETKDETPAPPAETLTRSLETWVTDTPIQNRFPKYVLQGLLKRVPPCLSLADTYTTVLDGKGIYD